MMLSPENKTKTTTKIHMTEQVATVVPEPFDVERNGVNFKHQWYQIKRKDSDKAGKFYPDLPELSVSDKPEERTTIEVSADTAKLLNFLGEEFSLKKLQSAYTLLSQAAWVQSSTVEEKDSDGKITNVWDDFRQDDYIATIQKLSVRGESLSDLREQYDEKYALLAEIASSIDEAKLSAGDLDEVKKLKKIGPLNAEIAELKAAMEKRSQQYAERRQGRKAAA